MDIRIEDYVNHDEVKEAILDGLRSYAKENAERVISNCGYHLATKVANEHLGKDAPQVIAAKCAEVLDGLSAHTLFALGGYGYQQSDARTMLDNAVRQNREALDKAVKAAIHNLTKREVVEIVKSGKVKMVIE